MIMGTAGTSISGSSSDSGSSGVVGTGLSFPGSGTAATVLGFLDVTASVAASASSAEILSYNSNNNNNNFGVGGGITMMTNDTTIIYELSSGGETLTDIVGDQQFSGANNMDLNNFFASTTASSSESFSSPVPGDTDDLFRDYDLALTQCAAVFCVIFIVLGVPGNLITIITLSRCKMVRNATAYFVINLSACDLMFCCFNLPLQASMFWNRHWVHGDTLCRLFPLFRYGLMAVSIFTVLAITINRYVMIGHPRVYPRLYRTRFLGVMILLIWLGSFGALVPTLLGVWGKFDLDKEIGSCSILRDSNNRSPKEFLFIIAFVLPCCAIIICYARIFCIVRKATQNLRPVEVPSSAVGNVNHSLETESLSPADQATILRRTSAHPSIAVIHQKGKMTNKDRKLLWMIVVIFGAFVVCYLPITIFKAVVKHKNSTWNIFVYLLIYVTTCINPLVYVLMSSDYRQAYTNLFLCRKDWDLSSRTISNSHKFSDKTKIDVEIEVLRHENDYKISQEFPQTGHKGESRK